MEEKKIFVKNKEKFLKTEKSLFNKPLIITFILERLMINSIRATIKIKELMMFALLYIFLLSAGNASLSIYFILFHFTSPLDFKSTVYATIYRRFMTKMQNEIRRGIRMKKKTKIELEKGC